MVVRVEILTREEAAYLLVRHAIAVTEGPHKGPPIRYGIHVLIRAEDALGREARL